MKLYQFFETDTITGKIIVQRDNPAKECGRDIIKLYMEDFNTTYTVDTKILFQHNIPDAWKNETIKEFHAYSDSVVILVI